MFWVDLRELKKKKSEMMTLVIPVCSVIYCYIKQNTK